LIGHLWLDISSNTPTTSAHTLCLILDFKQLFLC
jgi:hypothetical protein